MLEMSLLIPIANPNRWMNEKRHAALFPYRARCEAACFRAQSSAEA